MRRVFTSAGIASAATIFCLLTGAGTAWADNSGDGDNQNAHTGAVPQQQYSSPEPDWQFNPRSNRTGYHSNTQTPTGPYPDDTTGKVHS